MQLTFLVFYEENKQTESCIFMPQGDILIMADFYWILFLFYFFTVMCACVSCIQSLVNSESIANCLCKEKLIYNLKQHILCFSVLWICSRAESGLGRVLIREGWRAKEKPQTSGQRRRIRSEFLQTTWLSFSFIHLLALSVFHLACRLENSRWKLRSLWQITPIMCFWIE